MNTSTSTNTKSIAIPPVITSPPLDNLRPLWSIMIPTFNCAKYLRQTIQSVLAQDQGPMQMQIEVVDDCSTLDDPAAVVKEVGKGRVQFYRQTKNVGATHNFNTCIERSRGHLIHILHGDDWVESNFYEEFKSMSEMHQGASLLASRFYYVDECGIKTGISPRLPLYEQAISHDSTVFSEGPVIHFVGVVMKRQFFEDHGGFNPYLIHAADWEMWVRAIRDGGVIMSPKVLGNYRVFTGNDTGRLMRSAENLNDRQRCIDLLSAQYNDFDTKRAKLSTLRMCESQERRFREIGDINSANNNRRFWNNNATSKIKINRFLCSAGWSLLSAIKHITKLGY